MENIEYTISRDKTKLNVDLIHDFLSNRTYWAKDRSRQAVEKSIEHSICFGLYGPDNNQIGFARVITDFTVYAYLMDVFIIETHRGRGLGKLLMAGVMRADELKAVRKWALATRDAHRLYEQFGFNAVSFPERLMERRAEEPVLASERDAAIFFEALLNPPEANPALKKAASSGLGGEKKREIDE